VAPLGLLLLLLLVQPLLLLQLKSKQNLTLL